MFVFAAFALLAVTASAQDLPPAPLESIAMPPFPCSRKVYGATEGLYIYLAKTEGPFDVSPYLPLYTQAVPTKYCGINSMAGVAVTACTDSTSRATVGFVTVFGKVLYNVSKKIGVAASVTMNVYCRAGAGSSPVVMPSQQPPEFIDV